MKLYLTYCSGQKDESLISSGERVSPGRLYTSPRIQQFIKVCTNQKAYWASSVGTAVVGAPPIIGPLLLRIVRGGDQIGAVTLARFYGLHIWWMPIMLLSLIGAHLYLIIKIGITSPPERSE